MPVEFFDLERAKAVYWILEAVDWKWTVEEVLDQPEELLRDVLQIKGLMAKMERQQEKKGEG